MSFTPIGTPWSGPRQRPAASSASARRAASRASAAMMVTKAFSVGLNRSMRARCASVTSTGDTVRARMRLASSAIERKQRSGSTVIGSDLFDDLDLDAVGGFQKAHPPAIATGRQLLEDLHAAGPEAGQRGGVIVGVDGNVFQSVL